MLNPQNLLPGQEQFERFTKFKGFKNVAGRRGAPTLLYQYDYRDIDGKLFSVIRGTLEECRKSRDKWLFKKYDCSEKGGDSDVR
jgi:hypothetical protein